MSVARWKAEHETAITKALGRLGAARRERLTADDYDVYTDGLRGYPVAAVVAVCEAFARKPVEEFGPRFPTLGAIVEGVRDQLRREQAQREMNTRRLPEGRMVDPPKVAELKARVNELIKAKTMPGCGDRQPGSDDQ